MSNSNKSLIYWLYYVDSIDSEKSCDTIEVPEDAHYKLADGFICARVLHKISPQYFNNKWLEGINPVPPNGSWRLRVSNLKRILQKIHDYASDVLFKQFKPDAIFPDVAVIAQNFDLDQISRLVQLVLCCAVNCDKKLNFVNQILTLPTQVQHDIMEAIQELLIKQSDHAQAIERAKSASIMTPSKQNDNTLNNSTASTIDLSNISSNMQQNISSPSSRLNSRPLRRDSQILSDNSYNTTHQYLSTSQSGETMDDVKQKLFTALKLYNEEKQTIHNLEQLLKNIKIEKEQLQIENEKLYSDLNTKQTISNITNTKSSNIYNGETKSDDETRLNDSNTIKLKNDYNKLREDLFKSETERDELQIKLMVLKEETEELRLKNQDLKQRADKAKQLQDELDEFKQLSEKINHSESKLMIMHKKIDDLKRENKILEEKNTQNISKIVQLEDKNNSLESIINQMNIYKNQFLENQHKLMLETRRADQAEVEVVIMNEKNQFIQNEVENLKRFIEESKKAKTSFDIANGRNSQIDSMNDIVDDNLDNKVELKDRISRLEVENRLLQSKLYESKIGLDSNILEDLLKEANVRTSALEQENSSMRKRVLVLEAKLKNQTQNIPFNIQLDSSSDNTTILINRVEELQGLLFAREKELSELEIKYKKNTQKAKEVLKMCDSNNSITFSPSSSFMFNSHDEIGVLRQKCHDLEKQLINKERELAQTRKFKEMHEKLMISAFYSLTTPRQFNAADQRLDEMNNSEKSISINKSINSQKS